MERLPEPLRHPGVARAAISPTAAAAAAAGVAIGAFGAHSLVIAAVLGAGAWLGRMGAAVLARARRRKASMPRPADADPWSVPEPWRQLVAQAAGAQTQFDQAVRDWPDGPIRDRLADLRPALYSAVSEISSMARAGAALGGWAPSGLVRSGRPTADDLSRQLREVGVDRERAAGAGSAHAASLARSEEAIAAQLRAVRAGEEAAAGAQDRLRVLVARLDEAVTALLLLRLESAGASAVLAGASGPASGRQGDATPALGSAADALAESLSSLSDEVAALRSGLADAAATSARAASPRALVPPAGTSAQAPPPKP